MLKLSTKKSRQTIECQNKSLNFALKKQLFHRSADFECVCGSSPEHIALKKQAFRRSADLECAPCSSPGRIDFPRIDNIKYYLEAKIVNVYKRIGKPIIFL